MSAATLIHGPRGLAVAMALGVAVLASGFVAVQGVAGFGGWIEFGASEDELSDTLAQVYEAEPQLTHLQSHAPDVHTRLITIVRRDVELGIPFAQTVANARKLFDDWRADAMPDAPDRVLNAYLELATDRLRELEETNPRLCAAITLGQPADEPAPWLSTQHLQREMYIDLMLMRASPNEPVSVMTRAEMQSIRRDIEIALHIAFGENANLLYVSRETTPEEDAIICQLGIATMNAVAALGADRTPAAVRAMFFGR